MIKNPALIFKHFKKHNSKEKHKLFKKAKMWMMKVRGFIFVI